MFNISSGVTVSYYSFKESEGITKKIYDLHVHSSIRIIRLFSYFLCGYFSVMLLLNIIKIFLPDELDWADAWKLIDWGLALGVSVLGILMGITGLKVLKVASKGTSKKYANALLGFSIIFLVTLLYSSVIRYSDYKAHWDSIYGNGESYAIAWIILSFTISGFVLGFFYVKAIHWHQVLVQSFKKLQEGGGFDPINENQNLESQ
mmetsp:Transcript_13964/g.13966  ORF Transcript_13964/g.13966 Transcript_13964/m.13966 type:complete len:204 (+) Transcript_13964:3-614(+)